MFRAPALLFCLVVLPGTLVASGPNAWGDPDPIFPDDFESGDTSAWVQLVAFRMSDLDLKDPHFFAAIIGCTDVTNFELGEVRGINPTLQLQIQTDDDENGFLDLSLASTFLMQPPIAGSTALSRLLFPDCSAPMASTSCTLPEGSVASSGAATTQGGSAVCLEPVTGTTSGYSPAVVSAIAPVDGTCFAASLGTFSLPIFGGVPLIDTWVGGEWFDSPVSEIRDGLIRGFLTETTANSTIVPEGTTGIDAIDGEPISSLLRGGVNSCSQPSPAVGDKDVHQGMSGWYVYLNFPAIRVPYLEL